MVKVTPEEIKALVARMARLPEAKPIVAGIKRFTPDELTKGMNDRTKPPRVPMRPSTASRIKSAVKAANAAGIDVQRVEVDGVTVTAKGTEQPRDEWQEWKGKHDANKLQRAKHRQQKIG